jgi:hypothetical protein
VALRPCGVLRLDMAQSSQVSISAQHDRQVTMLRPSMTVPHSAS